MNKGAGKGVWLPWEWEKSSSILPQQGLEGCDQMNGERVKSGKLQLKKDGENKSRLPQKAELLSCAAGLSA